MIRHATCLHQPSQNSTICTYIPQALMNLNFLNKKHGFTFLILTVAVIPDAETNFIGQPRSKTRLSTSTELRAGTRSKVSITTSILTRNQK